VRWRAWNTFHLWLAKTWVGEGGDGEGIGVGFMCYVNNVIATVSKPRTLYCYFQTTDELIDAGWKIRVKGDANS